MTETPKTKNETLEQQVADLTAQLEATEQRATMAEQALADRRTPEQTQLDADTAVLVNVLQRDTTWRTAEPAA
jgi:hypothetical protein